MHQIDGELAAIFAQLHDPTSWPAPPPRPVRPATAEDLRPAELIPVSADQLQPWEPAAGEKGVSILYALGEDQEITETWPPVTSDRS
jgi:hypothetical protein